MDGRDPRKKYSAELILAFYANYMVTLENNTPKEKKARDQLVVVMVRGEDIDISERTISRFLYGPKLEAPAATLYFDYRMEALKKDHNRGDSGASFIDIDELIGGNKTMVIALISDDINLVDRVRDWYLRPINVNAEEIEGALLGLEDVFASSILAPAKCRLTPMKHKPNVEGNCWEFDGTPVECRSAPGETQGRVTPETSAVALVATVTLKGSGMADSVSGGGVMKFCNSDETVAPVTCPSTRSTKLEETPLTRAHIFLMRISFSTHDCLRASRNSCLLFLCFFFLWDFPSSLVLSHGHLPSTLGCSPNKSIKGRSSSDFSNLGMGKSWGFRSCCSFRIQLEPFSAQ
ncbi:hypothetical protein HAX54_034946 [Datura stramonium]|uniref:Uncharacterized protein n=1 Tax=Datura stramonium TaxID=4076 RepID=A0ABS8VEV1_DATST|nr:hypothetical protein [Datura stramonium]